MKKFFKDFAGVENIYLLGKEFPRRFLILL